MKTPPASEDANGVFHAFTSLKVAALEMKTTKRRLRSGRLRIFFSAVCASRLECWPDKSAPGVAHRLRIIFLALAFEFLLGFPETRHARGDFSPLAREPFFLFRHQSSRLRLIRVRHDWRARMGHEWGNGVAGLWSRCTWARAKAVDKTRCIVVARTRNRPPMRHGAWCSDGQLDLAMPTAVL